MTSRGWSCPRYEAIAQWVGERAGLSFPASQRHSAEAGIRRAMSSRADDLAEYRQLLEADDSAFAGLIAELTVGESYFFREPAQFDFVRQQVVPSLLLGRGAGDTIRAWSAGCASGEEAYSLAILFREQGAESSVVGTDISPARLERAIRARYTDWSLRGVPDAVVERHFVPRGKQWEVKGSIREAVEFRYLNLAEDRYPWISFGMREMDIVLCRNVLIYLNKAAVARVASRLLGSLSDHGWLFLGASDPFLADILPCEVIVTGAGVAYRRAAAGGSRNRAPSLTHSTASRVIPPPAPATERRPRPRPSRLANAEPSLPDPSACADGNAEIVRAYAERDYARAAELAGERVAGDDSDPATWILLVRSLANQGLLEQAGRSCAAAIERHRASAELMYLHAVLLMADGRHSDAAAAARRALYLDRGLIVAHIALCTALTRLDDVDGARRALVNAERLLVSLRPTEVVPMSDGEAAGRLIDMTRVQLKLLRQPAA